MKYLLILLLIISLPCFSQDKMGFGNDPEGADSAGFGTVTTWVKPSTCSGVTIGGECYDTVRIGSQTWLKRNLHFDDGEGGVRSYNNNDSLSDIYGYLYDWNTLERIDGLIDGWHIPNNTEWNTLVSYLTNNGYGYEGSGDDIAKSISSKYNWNASSVDGSPGKNPELNDSTKLSFIPSGRWTGFVYTNLHENSSIWSTSMYNINTVYCFLVRYNYSTILFGTTAKNNGFAIRLIKD